MQNRELVRQQQRLDQLFRRVASFGAGDIEMMSHWAKYLCVLCSGFLENAIGEVYISFTVGKARDEVVNYASSSLSKIRNPKVERFVATAKAFNDVWASDLESFVEDNGRKEAINSIMSNRHKIAHGENSNITIARLKDWFQKSIEVVEFIEQQTLE